MTRIVNYQNKPYLITTGCIQCNIDKSRMMVLSTAVMKSNFECNHKQEVIGAVLYEMDWALRDIDKYPKPNKEELEFIEKKWKIT